MRSIQLSYGRADGPDPAGCEPGAEGREL
jgi:hypothetical protein